MKIWMNRFLHASAYSYLTIDEEVLKDINKYLARYYVLATNLSEAPQIESVKMLETLLIEYDHNEEYTNDYEIVFKGLIKEDGTVDKSAHYESFYDVVYDSVIDCLYDVPFEIEDCDTIDYNFEVVEE